MKRVLMIIGGGIAAYKCLDLVRRLRERGYPVRCVMTKAAQEFVTPLAVGAISNERVATDLFDLEGEREIGHIRMARDADIVVVAPATADLMARMAQGHANDLATAVLLATRAPILIAPAMNPAMWSHAATQRNVRQLERDGAAFIGPNAGEMAEQGEAGVGRMAEVPEIVARIEEMLGANDKGGFGFISVGATRGPRPLLAGRHVLVTSGPTHEPIDPVRFLSNRSSGKQGFAIAGALAALGARVTLVAGPVTLPTPPGVTRIDVETALAMADAVQAALPADAAIMVAAVADWRVGAAAHKIKKGGALPDLKLVENPDILATVAKGPARPRLVVGFAAETDQVIAHAEAKLARKGADWIVANDVSGAVMGGDDNSVHIVSAAGVDSWPALTKAEVARRLADRIATTLNESRP